MHVDSQFKKILLLIANTWNMITIKVDECYF